MSKISDRISAIYTYRQYAKELLSKNIVSDLEDKILELSSETYVKKIDADFKNFKISFIIDSECPHMIEKATSLRYSVNRYLMDFVLQNVDSLGDYSDDIFEYTDMEVIIASMVNNILYISI